MEKADAANMYASAPPAYSESQQAYPPTQQPGYPPQQQPGYPPESAYPPQQAGYPPQQSYPPQHAGYPPQQQAGYAPQEKPGYPPQQQGYPPQQPGYAPQQPGGYPQPVVQQPGAYQQTQTTVIVGAQPVVQRVGPTDIPPNNAVLAWLTCIFCCWPLGLAAIFKSSEVNSAIARGDLVSAHNASRQARQYALAALIFGIIGSIGLVVYFVM